MMIERLNAVNDEDAEERMGWNTRAYIPAKTRLEDRVDVREKKTESFANLL